jgi:hypothetical protein
MKDATCDTLCVGSKYFAIQYGRDCYCFEDAPTKNNDQSACTYPNTGDRTQIGGSDTAYSVFTTAGYVPGTTLATFIGYFSPITSETIPGSLLSGNITTAPDPLTQESCKASCSAYKYFALSKGNTCQCGNSYSSVDAVKITQSDIFCTLKLGLDLVKTQAGGGLNCVALFGNPDYKVRPGLLTLCSNLCSANMKTYTLRLVWLIRLRFGPALVAIRGGYAAKPALRPRQYSRQELEVRVGHGLLDLDHDAIDTISPRPG